MLGCTCGIVECWFLLVRITVRFWGQPFERDLWMVCSWMYAFARLSTASATRSSAREHGPDSPAGHLLCALQPNPLAFGNVVGQW